MNQKLALLIFAFAFAVAIVAGFFSPDDGTPSPSDFRAKLRENLPAVRGGNTAPAAAPAPEASGPAESGSPSSSLGRDPAGSRIADTRDSLGREELARKYGDRLRFSFEGGRLRRIEGAHVPASSLEGPNRVPGFRPASESDLKARAGEILRDVSGLLGGASGATFAEPILRTGDATAQAFFQQSIDGVPVYPGGLVSLVIGADGEIRALDSSVYADIRVVNAATRPQPENSRKILFAREALPVAILHYAYETREKGMQRIYDAQTGELLLERNQKIH